MRRATVPRETARRLMRELLRRRLMPGDRLAPEPQLIAEFGVSRGSLREALRLLSFLGAIETQVGQQGGILMATPDPGVIVSTLAMVAQSRGATPRMAMEAARLIEPTSASMAARHRSDKDLEALQQSVDDLRRADSAREFERINLQFHFLLSHASANELFAILVPAVVAMIAAKPWDYPPAARRALIKEKVRIVEAIATADSMAANTLMSDHLTRTLQWLERAEPEWLDQPISWPDVDEYFDMYGHLFTSAK